MVAFLVLVASSLYVTHFSSLQKVKQAEEELNSFQQPLEIREKFTVFMGDHVYGVYEIGRSVDLNEVEVFVNGVYAGSCSTLCRMRWDGFVEVNVPATEFNRLILSYRADKVTFYPPPWPAGCSRRRAVVVEYNGRFPDMTVPIPLSSLGATTVGGERVPSWSAGTETWIRSPVDTVNAFLLYEDCNYLSPPSDVFIGEINGLVLFWNFDEGVGVTANDLSGNNNDGLIINALWVEGRYGSSLLFNGVDAYVEAADSPSLDLQFLTITAWVDLNYKPGATWQLFNHAVVEKIGSYHLVVDSPTGRPHLYGNTGTWNELTRGEANVIGNWHFVAVSYGNVDANTYVDNNVWRWASLGPLVPNDNPLRVGAQSPNVEAALGRIDEVAIFGRELTWQEINLIRDYRIHASPFYPGVALIRYPEDPRRVMVGGTETR